MCVCCGFKDKSTEKIISVTCCKSRNNGYRWNNQYYWWDFRIMHNEIKIPTLKYSQTWLKIPIICGVLEFACLLCTLLLLKGTEQLLYRIRVALSCEWHLSPWEGGFKPVKYFGNLFFLKITEKGRDYGVFIKCDKCFHKWRLKMRALLSLHLEFLCEGTLVTEKTFAGGLLWTPHCRSYAW